VAEWKALGKTAYNLYSVMVSLDKPQRAKALAERSKLNVKQVYRALKKLRKFGLVEKVKGGFQAIPYTNDMLIEQVAIPAGTVGKTEARKRKHQRQRATLAGKELYLARFGLSNATK
jgi:predicted transcriptional regulator